MIRFESVKIGYKKEAPLLNLTMSLPETGFFALLGKNGTGKSSFYKTLMGMVPAQGGEIRGLGPEDVLLVSDDTGLPGEVFFQDLSQLFQIPEEDLAGVFEGRVGQIKEKKIQDLSSGQKKIAEIALALLKKKKVLLLDEAANALDDENVHYFHSYLYQAAESALIFYTSHNFQEIVDLAIPLFYIRDKKLVYHDRVSDVNEIRELLGISRG